MRRLLVKAIVFFGVLYGLSAAAQTQVAGKVSVVNTTTSTAEPIACNAGVSPCTIGASPTTVLNKNVNRHECLIQNVGLTDFYCLKGAGTVSLTNMHFVIRAASGTNKGDGGSYSCNQGPVVWGGVISCLSSGSGGVITVAAD